MESKNFRTYEIALTAGQESTLRVRGNMYAVVENTADFIITFDESNRIAKATSGTGGEFSGEYTDVKLISPTTQSVTIVLGFGKYRDARASVNATLNATVAPSDTLDNDADITVGAAAVLLKAADPNTKEILIHVPSDSANSIRVGNAAVSAGTGLEVEAGMSLQLSTEAAVYAIRDGASDVTVSTLKLTRP